MFDNEFDDNMEGFRSRGKNVLMTPPEQGVYKQARHVGPEIVPSLHNTYGHSRDDADVNYGGYSKRYRSFVPATKRVLDSMLSHMVTPDPIRRRLRSDSLSSLGSPIPMSYGSNRSRGSSLSSISDWSGMNVVPDTYVAPVAPAAVLRAEAALVRNLMKPRSRTGQRGTGLQYRVCNDCIPKILRVHNRNRFIARKYRKKGLYKKSRKSVYNRVRCTKC